MIDELLVLSQGLTLREHHMMESMQDLMSCWRWDGSIFVEERAKDEWHKLVVSLKNLTIGFTKRI